MLQPKQYIKTFDSTLKQQVQGPILSFFNVRNFRNFIA
jgi:hypothetical protein